VSISIGSTVIAGGASGSGGGASIPVTNPADLLSGVTPERFVVIDDAGDGALLTAAQAAALIGVAPRRPAASSTTRLIYECNEMSGPLRNTGTDAGAAWDLTVRSNSVRRSRPLASTIGPGFGVEYASAPTGASGAAGLTPTGVTSAVTMWAVVCPNGGVISGQSPVPIFTRDHNAAWSGAQTTSVGLYWGNALEARLSVGASTHTAYAFGRSYDGQRVVGLTYDGSALRLWYDGEQIAPVAATGDIAWGTDGEWQIGHNAQTLEWTGTILRCGLESVAWSADQWVAFVQTCRGDLG